MLRNLSQGLTSEFGQGFSERNLRYIRQFYLFFPIRNTLCAELSWSHYRLLIRLESENARKFYCEEAVRGSWSVRVLERQINSFYYERLLSSKNKVEIVEEMQKKTSSLSLNPQDFLKDPYVLEFLDFNPGCNYLEKDIEQALITRMQKFLLELGRGFSFVARQQRIATVFLNLVQVDFLGMESLYDPNFKRIDFDAFKNDKLAKNGSVKNCIWRPQGDSNPCYRRERAMS